MSSFWSLCRRAAPGLPALALLLSGCIDFDWEGDGKITSDDDESGTISVWTPSTSLTDVTGIGSVDPGHVLLTGSGSVIVFDGVSRSVIIIDGEGNATLLTSQAQLTATTNQSPVLLGPIDEIRPGGTLAGEWIAADSVSGLLLRLQADGTPVVHVTEAEITAVTGETTARMSQPRSLTTNLIIAPDAVMAQDTVSNHIVNIDSLGAVTILVTRDVLGNAAGLNPPDAVVAGWARGPVSGDHFARFEATAHIVRVQTSGGTDRYVDSTTLASLFPAIANLTVLALVADSASDMLFILTGDQNRGVAVATVSADGSQVAVFTDETEFQALTGSGYDIQALGTFDAGVPYAIDGGTEQVLIFDTGGVPVIFGLRADLEAVSGSTLPALSVSSSLGSPAQVVVFEIRSQSFLLVE